MKYYKLAPSELEKELDTDLESGLSSKQVEERFRECGYNTRYKRPKFTLKYINPLFLVISLFVGITYLIVGLFTLNQGLDYVFCGIAVLCLTVITHVIFLSIKYIVDRKMYLSALNDPATLTVIRNGEPVKIKHTEVLYGDVVLLEKGDYIPFDGILISSNGLVTDETDISGMDRVSKHTGVISDDNLKISQLFNTVLCGSYVIHGKAKVVVTDVCSRVYLVKAGKNNSSKTVSSSKIVDVSTVFLTIFSLFCVIFTVICGLISKDYVGIITAIMVFASLIVSGVMKIYSSLALETSFLNLNKRNIRLKSPSELKVINNSDILLLNHDTVLDDKFEVSGFISESMECKPVSDVGKNNFSVFLYAAFCLEENSPVFKSCYKILKKVGVDFSDINTMCPVFSRLNKKDGTISICARAYEGNNMLIALGDYNNIKSMCSNEIPSKQTKELNAFSTEMLAVAVKKVDVIPDDLSVQLNDFTCVGVLGINRKLSADISKKMKMLKRSGVHPLVLFPGDHTAALSAVGGEAKIISFNNIDELTASDFKNAEFLCDYNGNIQSLLDVLAAKGMLPSYFGDKFLRDKKSIAFKSETLSMYETKDADVVLPYGFNSVFNTFFESKKAFFLINSAFSNMSLFTAFYVVCGVLFSLLFKEILVAPITCALILFVVLPIVYVKSLFSKVSEKEVLTGNCSADPLHNKQISFIIMTSILFLLICVITKFVVPSNVASSFLLMTFIAYLCVSVNDIFKKPIYTVYSLIIPLVLSVMLLLPFSHLLGFSSFNVFVGVISLIVGIGAKLLCTIICRSVKI